VLDGRHLWKILKFDLNSKLERVTSTKNRKIAAFAFTLCNYRNILGGKGGRSVRLTTYDHILPLSRNLGALTSQKPLGLFRPVTGLLYL